MVGPISGKFVSGFEAAEQISNGAVAPSTSIIAEIIASPASITASWVSHKYQKFPPIVPSFIANFSSIWKSGTAMGTFIIFLPYSSTIHSYPSPQCPTISIISIYSSLFLSDQSKIRVNGFTRTSCLSLYDSSNANFSTSSPPNQYCTTAPNLPSGVWDSSKNPSTPPSTLPITALGVEVESYAALFTILSFGPVIRALTYFPWNASKNVSSTLS